MKWSYRCHDILVKPLRFIVSILNGIIDHSWYVAHYKNGKGPKWDFDKKDTLWRSIKNHVKGLAE